MGKLKPSLAPPHSHTSHLVKLSLPNILYISHLRNWNSTTHTLKLEMAASGWSEPCRKRSREGVGEAKSYQRLQYPAYNWLFCALYIALHGVEVEIGTCLYQLEVQPRLSAHTHEIQNKGCTGTGAVVFIRGWIFIETTMKFYQEFIGKQIYDFTSNCPQDMIIHVFHLFSNCWWVKMESLDHVIFYSIVRSWFSVSFLFVKFRSVFSFR